MATYWRKEGRNKVRETALIILVSDLETDKSFIQSYNVEKNNPYSPKENETKELMGKFSGLMV